MTTESLRKFSLGYPRTALTLYFIIWKAILLLIALISPGHGYDTSTDLTLDVEGSNREPWYQGSRIIEKLTRWDAIYFTQVATSGYTYEQQWMAGWGFTKLLGFSSSLNPSISSAASVALFGILVAHISHLFSVFVLYELSLLVFESYPPPKRSSIVLLTACLHIISPAGMFLSAPYAESLFALLNFAGFYLYGSSCQRHSASSELSTHCFLFSSGLCFAVASTVRGNGLLSGLIFVYEAVKYIWAGLFREGFSSSVHLRRFCALLLTGLVMGCVAFYPQYLAYREYCTPSAKRPWCSHTLPSIYGWVQSEYWYVTNVMRNSKLTFRRDVGFLHYWTLSNLPLFILAFPMLYIMFASGIWVWFDVKNRLHVRQPDKRSKTSGGVETIDEGVESNLTMQAEMLRGLAIPQMVLALLAFTTYHVQIITRLSSGYPIWYWWLAHMILQDDEDFVVFGKRMKLSALIVRWIVMYAVIQGGLFASFLPPA